MRPLRFVEDVRMRVLMRVNVLLAGRSAHAPRVQKDARLVVVDVVPIA